MKADTWWCKDHPKPMLIYVGTGANIKHTHPDKTSHACVVLRGVEVPEIPRTVEALKKTYPIVEKLHQAKVVLLK